MMRPNGNQAPQGTNVRAGQTLPTARYPTPYWEYGLLGLFQSRTRMLNPVPNRRLTPYHGASAYSWRPFGYRVQGPWLRAIYQEGFRMSTRTIPNLWFRG